MRSGSLQLQPQPDNNQLVQAFRVWQSARQGVHPLALTSGHIVPIKFLQERRLKVLSLCHAASLSCTGS